MEWWRVESFIVLYKIGSTAWKVSVFAIILVCIFPHSDWIRRDTPYLSVFSPNAGKCGPEKLRVRTLFTRWRLVACYSGINNTSEHVFAFWDSSFQIIRVILRVCYYFIELTFGSICLWCIPIFLSTYHAERKHIRKIKVHSLLLY